MHRFERWSEVIQGAPDEKAIMDIMRAYAQAIPATVVAAIPAECQRALGDHDIQDAAICILHCELTYQGEPAVAELLHEIAHTYAAASLRIARLARDPVSPRGR